MPHWQTTGLTVFAGLVAVIILGRLPGLERDTQARRVQTAVSAPLYMLSDDNLTDAMVTLRFRQRLTRVGWDHSILTVDLTVRPQTRSAEPLWHDVAELTRFSFGEAGNVRQLLVRVYQETGGRRVLLLYGDGHRQDWTGKGLLSMPIFTDYSNDEFLRTFGLVTTVAGDRWLRNISN
jgi:hypothetical protein